MAKSNAILLNGDSRDWSNKAWCSLQLPCCSLSTHDLKSQLYRQGHPPCAIIFLCPSIPVPSSRTFSLPLLPVLGSIHSVSRELAYNTRPPFFFYLCSLPKAQLSLLIRSNLSPNRKGWIGYLNFIKYRFGHLDQWLNKIGSPEPQHQLSTC